MSDCLIVIGNGFDLFHGIPSSYWDFKEYLECRQDAYYFLERMERFIDTTELWKDFEGALGELDEDELRDYFIDEVKSYGDDDWSDSYHHSYQLAIEEELGFASQIPKHLKDWINNLNLDDIKPLLPMHIISPDAFYITFNYTETLEQVYHIPDKQICHIHGSVSDGGELIVGHGNKASFKRPSLYSYEEEDDVRLVEGEELIKKYFKDTYKNVERIIKDNKKVWDRLKKVKMVYIFGHSLSDIDMPYFKKIYQSVHPDCKWLISYHKPKEKVRLPKALEEVGIGKNNISTIRLNELKYILF